MKSIVLILSVILSIGASADSITVKPFSFKMKVKAQKNRYSLRATEGVGNSHIECEKYRKLGSFFRALGEGGGDGTSVTKYKPLDFDISTSYDESRGEQVFTINQRKRLSLRSSRKANSGCTMKADFELYDNAYSERLKKEANGCNPPLDRGTIKLHIMTWKEDIVVDQRFIEDNLPYATKRFQVPNRFYEPKERTEHAYRRLTNIIIDEGDDLRFYSHPEDSYVLGGGATRPRTKPYRRSCK